MYVLIMIIMANINLLGTYMYVFLFIHFYFYFFWRKFVHGFGEGMKMFFYFVYDQLFYITNWKTFIFQ